MSQDDNPNKKSKDNIVKIIFEETSDLQKIKNIDIQNAINFYLRNKDSASEKEIANP